MRLLHRADPSLKEIARDAAALRLREELQEGWHELILPQLPAGSGDVQVRAGRLPPTEMKGRTA